MIQIYLRGVSESGYLDLLPGTSLDLEALSDAFDEDMTTGVFSLPLDFPWTENNRRLLSFAERLSNSPAQQNYWSIDVLDDGYPELLNAKLTLLEKTGNLSYTSGKFNGSISGTKGLFGSIIKNKKLRDFVLGGPIAFETDSREFATAHAKGDYPQFPQIGFAPVAIENFFDTSKSYNGEFLAKDTVNNIVSTGGGLGDWQFGRPLSSDETIATASGNEEYINYRTIPFFRFKFLLIEVFRELGYTVTGALTEPGLIDDLFLFNTTAIEFYSNVANADYNRKIFPADHVPDILASDFIKNALNFFNVYPVYGSNSVDLRIRKQFFKNPNTLDISDRCGGDFTATWAESTEQPGYTLDYTWDDSDDMRSDRVKDLTTKTLCGSVSTKPNLDTLDIGRPFTTDDIVFVESENMYYNVANATVIPILWDAWSERLGEYKNGSGSDSVSLGMGTLCNYVELDIPNALYVRRDKLGTRQVGSYWTDKYLRVVNNFTMRVFYIKNQVLAGNDVPVSMNSDRSANGTVLNPFSLGLEGPNGMLENFLKEWLAFKQNKQSVKMPVLTDKKFMNDLKDCNRIQIQNIVFLLQQTDSSLPLGPTVDLELVPLQNA